MLRGGLGSGMGLYGAWLREAGTAEPMNAFAEIKEKRGKTEVTFEESIQITIGLEL